MGLTGFFYFRLLFTFFVLAQKLALQACLFFVCFLTPPYYNCMATKGFENTNSCFKQRTDFQCYRLFI